MNSIRERWTSSGSVTSALKWREAAGRDRGTADRSRLLVLLSLDRASLTGWPGGRK